MNNVIVIILVLVVTIAFSWLFRYEVLYHPKQASAVLVHDRWKGETRLIIAKENYNIIDRVIFPSD